MGGYLWLLLLLVVCCSGLIQYEQHGFIHINPRKLTTVEPKSRIIKREAQSHVIPRQPVTQIVSDFYQLVHAPLPLDQDYPPPAYPDARPRIIEGSPQLTPATIRVLRDLVARRRVKREHPQQKDEPSSEEFMGPLLDSVNLSSMLETPICEACDDVTPMSAEEKEAREFHQNLCKKLAGTDQCLLQFLHRGMPEKATFEYEVLLEAVKIPGLMQAYKETGEMPDLEVVTEAVQDFMKVYQDVKIFLEKHVKDFQDARPRTRDLKYSNYIIGLIAYLDEIEDLPPDSITHVDKVPVAVRKRKGPN